MPWGNEYKAVVNIERVEGGEKFDTPRFFVDVRLSEYPARGTIYKAEIPREVAIYISDQRREIERLEAKVEALQSRLHPSMNTRS